MALIYNEHEFIRLFKENIPNEELISFIRFLRLSNAYDDYFKFIDIEKLDKRIKSLGFKAVYYQIIPLSLNYYENCHDMHYYWTLISALNTLRWILLYGGNFYINNWNYDNYVSSMGYITATITYIKSLLRHNKNKIDTDKYQELSKILYHIEHKVNFPTSILAI